MREPLYNQRFGDIYFSPEDGLAESRHVFLSGNGLPDRWRGRDHFTVAETGFGTGLNFLAVWQAFAGTAAPGAHLDYISFEHYPLAPDEIAPALARWRPDLGARPDAMLASYPLRVPGFHTIQLDDCVTLTLVFDDVNAALPRLNVPRGVDAWFLDGFAPAKNPDMWTDTLYEQMERLSAAEATAATFTVAGHVRRGLGRAGFAVDKKPGFGRKREMTAARREDEQSAVPATVPPRNVAVVGGGLAGAACAYVLGRYGYEPVIFETAETLAAAASGNSLGLYNPRFYAQRRPEADFYASAYALAFRTLTEMAARHDIGFDPCGALHLVNNEDKAKRFRSLCDQGGWHDDHARYVSAAEASAIAGIALDYEALYLPDSGFVSPRALCAAYAGDTEVRLKTPATTLKQRDGGWSVNGEAFDAVILACGAAAAQFAEPAALPVHTVRGQVTEIDTTGRTQGLRCNLCYGGYISRAHKGRHIVGSTFQKWLDHTNLLAEDDAANLDKLAAHTPFERAELTVTGSRAALRTVSADHLPVVGAAPGEDMQQGGCYVSTAHGSHGVISSLAAAHMLTSLIRCGPFGEAVQTLGAERFLKRAKRQKG